MRRKRITRFLMFLPLGLLVLAAVGWVVMSLWNAVATPVLGLSAIGYWQAWGLLILCRILFGGLRGGGGRGGWWRHRMMERCEKMTPEEREKFRAAFESRWGRPA